MNRILLLNFILTVTILLSACSKSEQAERESPLAEQQKALEQARQADKLMQDAAEKQRKQVEEQGG